MHGHGLDELAQLHLGHTPISYDEVTGTGRNRIPFSQVPIERATAYAAEDADVALRLWQALRPRLRFNGALALYEQVERRLLPVLLDMERAGIKVDADDLRRMSVDFEQRMAVIERDIHRLAGREFNVGSAKQLGEVLFDEMKLRRRQADEDRRLGHRRVGAADARRPGQRAAGAHPRLAAAAEAEIHLCRCAGRRDQSRHRPRAHLLRAVRSPPPGGCRRTIPNLQNIPIRTEEGSRIRRAFIAETGHLLVSADYSQIELRLLAHVADIPALRESFARGEDIHARTASEVFGIPMAGMDPMTRRRAKAINFGIIYGISGFGLARQLGITPGEARTLYRCVFRALSGHPRLHGAHEGGGPDQRLRDDAVRPPLLGARHRRQEPGAPRLCRTPGDQCAAAGRCRRHHQARDGAAAEGAAARPGCASRLLLQVHDELLFEAPEDEVAGADRAGAAGDGERGHALGAAGGGDRRRPHLGRRALTHYGPVTRIVPVMPNTLCRKCVHSNL